jgi:diguanylate cyclase (GGDEF)-like protein
MRQRIDELEKLAFLDDLTRIANRRYLELELESRFSEMKRYGLAFGILFMDIDHFNNINDAHGHQVGDMVLKTVSQTLVHNARPYDLFGRWGGEEFMGIIRHATHASLFQIGSRIRLLIEKTYLQTPTALLNLTFSIGGAMAASADTIQSLLKRADDLLYMSKEKGRDCLTMEQNPPSTHAGA